MGKRTITVNTISSKHGLRYISNGDNKVSCCDSVVRAA